MTPPRRVVWQPGFFTGRLHAVIAQPKPDLLFHGMPILWALCGAPVAAIPHSAGRTRCGACEFEVHRRTTRGEVTGQPPGAMLEPQ